MSNYELAYNELVGRIHAVKNKEAVYLFIAGFSQALMITFASVLIVSFIELAANGDETFRFILAAIVILTFVISAGFYLTPVLSRAFGFKQKASDDDIALRIGTKYPEIKDRLCNSMQLVKNINQHKNVSNELSLAEFSHISGETRAMNFEVIIEMERFKKQFLWFLSSLAMFSFIFVIFSSSIGSAFNRIVNWNESFLPPAPFSLSVEPVFKKVTRGEKVEIKIIAKGKFPESITLKIKEEQQENYDEYTLKQENGGSFKYEISSLKQSVLFYAEANWLNSSVISNNGRIVVTDKPFIRSISGRLVLPSYTNLTSQSFTENNGDITALRGSRVELSILANKELKNGSIVFVKKQPDADSAKPSKSDTLKYSLKINGNKAFGGFNVSSNGSYFISIFDDQGEANNDPINYSVTALNDAFPSISLIEPVTDVQVSENALLPIRVGISDDYGFSNLKLFYRLAESGYAEPDEKFISIDIPVLSGELSVEIPYLWDMNKLGISPEDKYEFYLEVFDNDVVSGPKSAKTRALTVRLPSLEEVMDMADDMHKVLEKDLEKVLKDAEDVKKEMENLNRELMKKPDNKELDWKEKKKAEDIKKKQEEIEKRLGDISENLQQMTEQLQQHNVLSPETIQKFMELQKLMSEVNSPELERMQQRLEEAMKNMTQEDLQKAMKESKFNEEAFRASIERTLKILKRLQAEQKVDALSKLAEQLSKEQEELRKEMENSNPNDEQRRSDLAKQQKSLQKALDALNKEARELEKLMKEIGDDMPVADMQQAEQELNYEETSEDMQDAQQEMQSGNFNKASKSQKKAGDKMQKFAQRMQKMKQDMKDKSTQEAIRKLQKAINDIINLSKKQEAIKDKTQMSDYNSTQLGEFAEDQAMAFESLANVANGLMALAEKSFAVTPEMGAHIGDALEQMQQSTKNLTERRTSNAVKSQQGAMSSMNQAIGEMQDMMSALQAQGSGQCDNPGGSGMGQGAAGNQGFGQKLQQLAAQQQGINQALQQTMGQGGKLTQQQQQQMGRIAKEQGGAGKSLQELAQEQKNLGGDERKTLGDLNQIAKEMQEVATDIQQGDITPETLKRQEHILSRLLDANRSIHDRDYEKQREARSGKDVTRKSPGPINLDSMDKTKSREDLLRSLQQGYTKDYEMLIRKYFESLGKEKVNGNQ